MAILCAYLVISITLSASDVIKKVDISACPLSAFEKQVAAETGFELVGHRLELYGLCRDCQEKEKREGKR